MAAAEGLVQGPASSGEGLVVVMVTWSICSPCISLSRARRRSKDDWVPLCRASRLVFSSRHFCQGRRGPERRVSEFNSGGVLGWPFLSPVSQNPSPTWQSQRDSPNPGSGSEKPKQQPNPQEKFVLNLGGGRGLIGIAQWIERRPVNQKVAGLIPSQGTGLGCGPSSPVGGA